jgi:hypothetical protein
MNSKLLIFFLFISLSSFAQNDNQLVEKAMMNYLDALYDARPELIKESVHPNLNKFGFYQEGKDKPFGKMGQMSFERLEKLAGEWNAAKKIISIPKKVEVLAVHDKIAIGKVSAEWGFDFIQLVKEDNKWLIINIVWQSPE